MREKLLVLDDELLILKSLQELFEEDYEVYSTHDAEQALLLAGEHDIAVILCDESMPGVPGHEFLRRVREISSAARVLMSEFADLAVYTPLARRRLVTAVVASSMVGLVVDSIVFLYLAFGSLDFLLGQIVGKAWMVLALIPLVAWLRRRDERLGLMPA